MQSAQSQLLAAEVALAAEHLQNLDDQLAAATTEGKRIEGEIKRTGEELVSKRAQAEPLWTARAAIDKARADLDTAFQQNDFAGAQETEQYVQKRAALADEWDRLTTKEIIPLSNVIGRLDHEFTQWKFARGRVAGRVNDLRQAIAERRGQKRF